MCCGAGSLFRALDHLLLDEVAMRERSTEKRVDMVSTNLNVMHGTFSHVKLLWTSFQPSFSCWLNFEVENYYACVVFSSMQIHGGSTYYSIGRAPQRDNSDERAKLNKLARVRSIGR